MGNPDVDQLCKEFFDWRLLEFPEFATFCGYHQYDDRLNDHSVASFERKKTGAEEYLKRCRSLKDTSGLSASDKENLVLLDYDLDDFLNGLKYQGYLFQVHYMEGIHMDFEQLTSWMKFNNADDFQKYLGRLRAMSARLDSEIVNMSIGIRSGKTHSSYSMHGVGDAISAQLCEPKETLYYAPFLNIPGDADQGPIKKAADEAEVVIKCQIQPALKRMKKCVEEEYIPACRPKEGISSIPDGEEFYKVALKWHTSTDITPQQVHDLGIKEVARIKAKMSEVIKQVGFEGDFKAFVAHLRENPKFKYEDKDACMEGFKDICYNQIRPTLTKLFKKIPESKMTIEPVPASRAAGPMGYYLAGTLDGSRPGIFYANIHNLSNCPKYEMMTLSLHEGEPGHHFQGMYAMESDEMPLFRRYLEDMYYASAPSKFPIHTAYCEGWGLYCEYLGNELGLYDDPYALFGHLSFEMHRACRLVADTGLHVFGWDYEKTVGLFLENTALSEPAIRNEVRRYITWPGQACAYKVGQLKILELRQMAADALGDKFDVREFHEDVLKCGMVPLSVLEQIVQQYINTAKA